MAAIAVAGCLLSGAAQGAEPWQHAPSERRCGFAMGIGLGAMLGATSGWRNDTLVIGRDEFRVDTGFGGGGAGNAWIGIAITDYLVFGLGGAGGRLASADHETTFGGFAFHLDLFPAYALGGTWKELGVSLDTGVAVSTTHADGGGDEAVIESGGASRVALGAFYEGIRLWKLSMGPAATVDLLFSPSALRPAGWIGWRTAFYGGP